LLEQYSQAAYAKAREKFDLESYVDEVAGVYEAIYGRPPMSESETVIDEEPPSDEDQGQTGEPHLG
jgi:hypothetical protein